MLKKEGKKKKRAERPGKSVEKLSQRGRERERRDGWRKKRKRKTLPHHNHAANWFSAVNLRSVFGQAISKTGEHEMISQRIYLDKSRGCWGVIGTTWLVMRGTRHDGGVDMDYQHSSWWGFMEGKKKKRIGLPRLFDFRGCGWGGKKKKQKKKTR